MDADYGDGQSTTSRHAKDAKSDDAVLWRSALANHPVYLRPRYVYPVSPNGKRGLSCLWRRRLDLAWIHCSNASRRSDMGKYQKEVLGKTDRHHDQLPARRPHARSVYTVVIKRIRAWRTSYWYVRSTASFLVPVDDLPSFE